MSAGVAGGNANWAHIGGFGFGALVALGLQTFHVAERFVHDAIQRQIRRVDEDVYLQLAIPEQIQEILDQSSVIAGIARDYLAPSHSAFYVGRAVNPRG